MPPTNRCAVQLHRHVVRYRPRPVSCAAARWRRRPAPATAAALGASGNGSCAGAAIGSASVGNAPRLPTTTVGRSTNICWVEGIVSRDDKERLLGQRGCILWFTGLSGAGKSTVACTLEHLLHERGHLTALLDGDNIRHGLNKDLGFSPEDRVENIRRIGEVAVLFKNMGALTMTSFISPYRAEREAVRARCKPGEFLEVFMNIPLEVCEARDPKGLYKKARAGLIKNFTGIDDPYEPPLNPEIVVDLCDEAGRPRSPQAMAEQILRKLEEWGYLRDPALPTLAVAAALQCKHSDGVLDYAQL